MTKSSKSSSQVRTMSYSHEDQMLCLFRGAEGTAFAVFELSCDEPGRRVFRLGKSDLTEKYTVSVLSGHAECDCAGGTYRGACRHGDAMVKLIQLGKV